ILQHLANLPRTHARAIFHYDPLLEMQAFVRAVRRIPEALAKRLSYISYDAITDRDVLALSQILYVYSNPSVTLIGKFCFMAGSYFIRKHCTWSVLFDTDNYAIRQHNPASGGSSSDCSEFANDRWQTDRRE